MSLKCIGIDIGGTSVKLGIFEEDGTLVKKWEVPTRKEEDGKYILGDIAASIRRTVKESRLELSDFSGAGMGFPGPVLPDGHCEVCVNLGWKAGNPQQELSRLLDGMPVKSGNDANVAALGEMWQGGGKGYKNLVMVTLGTGVGGGIILNEKIFITINSQRNRTYSWIGCTNFACPVWLKPLKSSCWNQTQVSNHLKSALLLL